MQNYPTNSIFGTFDDPILQARAAQAAALAEMDVKNVNMVTGGMLRSADMFSLVSYFQSNSVKFLKNY